MPADTKFVNTHGTTGTPVDQDPATSAYLMAINDESTTAKRDANPVVAPASGTVYSFERYTKLVVTGGTYTSVDNVRHYASGYSDPTGVTLNTSAEDPAQSTAFITPVDTVSGKADNAMPTSDPSAERIAIVGGGPITSAGGDGETEYGIVQIAVINTATAGSAVTCTWAWDEVA
jgi:hypothetical protein